MDTYLPSPQKIEEMKKKIFEENVANRKPPRRDGGSTKSKYVGCRVSKDARNQIEEPDE